MAEEVQTFNVTVTAGTPVASPHVAAIELGTRDVQEIQVEVPPGPRGEVGFWIGSAGTQIIPKNLGTFLVMDNVYRVFPLSGFFQSGSWEVHIYNTGHYDHTIQFTFLCNFVIGQTGAVSGTPIAGALLTG